MLHWLHPDEWGCLRDAGADSLQDRSSPGRFDRHCGGREVRLRCRNANPDISSGVATTWVAHVSGHLGLTI